MNVDIEDLTGKAWPTPAQVVDFPSRIAHYDSVLNRPWYSQNDARVTQLKEELFAIDTSVALLRRRFNAVLPANRLSPELLTTIFHFLALIEPHASLINRRRNAKARERLGWIAITQVCHRWRAVAESSALLWTPVSTAFGFGMARQMLQRTAAVPVAVELDEQHSSFAELLQHVSAEGVMAKAQELRYEGRWIGSLPGLLGSAPSLDSLYVNNRGPLSPEEEEFSGHLPSLQRLEIHGVGLTRPSLLRAIIFLPTITRLSISVNIHSQAVPFAQLVEIMSKLPQLEALRISGYSITPSDGNFLERDVSTPISIPNLRTLELDFSLPHVMVLLHRLHMHPDVRLSLNCDFGDLGSISKSLISYGMRLFADACNGKGACGDYFTALRSLEYRDVKAPCYPQHLVGPHLGEGIVISGWRDPSPDYLVSDFENENDSSPTPLPDVRIAFTALRIAPSVNLQDVISTLPLSIMHSLSIQPTQKDRQGLGISTWENLTERCHNVEWLRFDEIIAEDFLIVHDSMDLQTNMPKLKTIALFGVKWPMGSERIPSRNAEALLMEMLEERQSRGVPLQRLIVGETPYGGGAFSSDVYKYSSESNMKFGCLCRPSWMKEGHPDYTDDLGW